MVTNCSHHRGDAVAPELVPVPIDEGSADSGVEARRRGDDIDLVAHLVRGGIPPHSEPLFARLEMTDQWSVREPIHVVGRSKRIRRNHSTRRKEGEADCMGMYQDVLADVGWVSIGGHTCPADIEVCPPRQCSHSAPPCLIALADDHIERVVLH